MSGDAEQLERLRSALAHRYQIKRELGHGGMATVYLAEEPRHARHLALKVLLPHLAATIGADRFLREIKTTAGLTHPHILPLFDSGEADGFLFYVMPYVEGESLRDRLKREIQLPIDDALRIASDIADALGFAHSRQVVHRDIKPENILLEAGHAIVADFGIAKALTDASADVLTATGLAIGTPQYMSPEQAVASPNLDGRSDLYSLACVLFEMLAGDPPFAGSARQAILARKSLESPPRLRTVRETVPVAVEAAIAKALERVPGDRFRTMQQFVDALSTRQPARRSDNRETSIAARSVGEGVETLLPMELKPLDEELDAFGLTHPGKVQRVNQEHFLIFSVMRDASFHQTSLPNGSRLPYKGDRRAFVGMIADGVGRGAWGEEASRLAIEVMAQYLVHTVRSYDTSNEANEQAFLKGLQMAAIQGQANVAQRSWETPGAAGMTSGLTIYVGIWPRAYILHIGSSRLYALVDGQVSEVTKMMRSQQTGDQDVATDPLGTTQAAATAQGGQFEGSLVLPATLTFPQRWGQVGLMCTKGLTKHVPEEQIEKRLKVATSAKQACQELLEDALNAGGTENITMIVARTPNPRQ
ncbi:MAG TPA: protein kinase [Gemmatimonadaceae bacterium]|nr:protein kinase [Gemmatimonadaceae bacterium]